MLYVRRYSQMVWSVLRAVVMKDKVALLGMRELFSLFILCPILISFPLIALLSTMVLYPEGNVYVVGMSLVVAAAGVSFVLSIKSRILLVVGWTMFAMLALTETYYWVYTLDPSLFWFEFVLIGGILLCGIVIGAALALFTGFSRYENVFVFIYHSRSSEK